MLPYPDPEFKGVIGRTTEDSKPDFPQPISAPEGAPNVLLILTDDVGFGASSAFGGPVPTPTFEALAANGLKYNAFNTTALCSPTRAALITGRDQHTVHTGIIMERSLGYPGYDSLMPKSAGTVAEILRGNGYSTAWFGKNHNVPAWQSSAAGPFDLWPTGLGFDYFYGFIGGDINQWDPTLFENTTPIEPKEKLSGEARANYHLDADLADQAIHWIQQQHALAPNKPFFAYYAPGATHAPHHVPKDWIAKFKGQFDQGWDKLREETFARQKKLGVIPQDTILTPRPANMPAWDSLDARQKELFAHMAEIYAAFLAYDDYNIGRVIEARQDRRVSPTTRSSSSSRATTAAAPKARCKAPPTKSASSATARKRVSTTSTRSRTSSAVRSTTTICRCRGRGRSIRRSSGPSATPAISAASATAWS